MIAFGIFKDSGGANPAIRDWADVIAAISPPLNIFRPKKWPAEAIPGALQLPYAS
jgi:hypothetical protein